MAGTVNALIGLAKVTWNFWVRYILLPEKPGL
jgi:hypothetical protein